MRGRAVALLSAVLVVGCAVGPNYKRPAVDAPEVTRGQLTPVEAASLADLPWWQVFDDPVLQGLITEAIHGNYDLQTAIWRVEQSRQLVGVARADLLPQIGYQGEAARGRTFIPEAGNQTFNSFLGAFNVAWEIDIWGRIRRATESARADYLGSEEFRRGVLLTLVSDVAEAYFGLLELDRQLTIARNTTNAFQKILDLFIYRYEGDVGTLLDVSRGRASLAGAAATIPDLERQIAIKENQLSLLLGHNPGDILRGNPLDEQTMPPEIPTGLPSQLVDRRPDVLVAEQQVVAANANVGVAVGNFFPRLGLSALYGGQSSEIEALIKGTGNIWAIAGSLAGPIFQGGRLLASYRATDAAWEASVTQYQQTVTAAFGEVSNALVTEEKLKGVRAEREKQVAALQQAVDLSLIRYDEGVATYYEVLEAEQQLFIAQLELARVMRDQLLAVVLLYRALGGGWNLEVEQWAGAPPAITTAP
ncbi:MAG TPA: efflux transporter outer membrane subunit [Candidatus Binatia bacterium]|jgi:multidrug efflux system outer membrane protein|nr:efflux transporter outer membrane subunit [Candidatus Binatia bacterium]